MKRIALAAAFFVSCIILVELAQGLYGLAAISALVCGATGLMIWKLLGVDSFQGPLSRAPEATRARERVADGRAQPHTVGKLPDEDRRQIASHGQATQLVLREQEPENEQRSASAAGLADPAD